MALGQDPSFGALLRRWRLAAGLTQEALAERSGLSTRGISDLERGIKIRPHRETVRLLAGALTLSEERRAILQAAARGMPPTTAWDGRNGPPITTTSSAFPALVGRMGELESIEQHLDGAEPRVLMLAGEPGMGKTRLLDEAARRAADRGMPVLRGGCSRRSGEEPYAPLLEAFVSYLDLQPRAHRRLLLMGATWLGHLVPELLETLGAPLPPGSLPAAQERRLAFAAATRFLTTVATPVGMLLILDDLQWAGSDALDLFVTIARTGAEIPIRILGAYRDTEVEPGSQFALTLADLVCAGLARRVPLAPLPPSEAARLLTELLAGEVGPAADVQERLVRRAGGLPFFLVSFAQSLRESAAQVTEPGLPWDLRQSIQQRLAVLSDSAQEMLQAAAVVGREGPYFLLAAVSALDETAMTAALDEACHARILTHRPHNVYEFAHDVIRDVIEADLGPARRAVLHLRAAEALECLGEPERASELAWHFVQGGAPERALPWSILAGDRAGAISAHGEAQRQYRQALELAHHIGDEASEGEVLEKLGQVLYTVGCHREAIEVLDRAAQIAQRAGDPEGEARITAQIGRSQRLEGKRDDGIARIRALLTSGRIVGSRGSAHLQTVLAHLLWSSDRQREALEVSERACALAQTVEDHSILAEAEMRRGAVLCALGETSAGRLVLEEAVPLAEATGELDTLCRALDNLADAHYVMGELERSREHRQRAVEVAEQLGDTSLLAYNLARGGKEHILLGNWSQAHAWAVRAGELWEHHDEPWAAWDTLGLLGLLCLARGDWSSASRYLRQTLEACERDAFVVPGMVEWQWWMALLHIWEGRPQLTIAHLEPVIGQSLHDNWPLDPEPLLAWAYLGGGNFDCAIEHAAQAVARARSEKKRLTLGWALLVQALAVGRRKRWEEAERIMLEALSVVQDMPSPWLEAHTRYQFGNMQREKGELLQAGEQLRHALAIFRRLGAVNEIAHIELVLAALPHEVGLVRSHQVVEDAAGASSVAAPR